MKLILLASIILLTIIHAREDPLFRMKRFIRNALLFAHQNETQRLVNMLHNEFTFVIGDVKIITKDPKYFVGYVEHITDVIDLESGTVIMQRQSRRDVGKTLTDIQYESKMEMLTVDRRYIFHLEEFRRGLLLKGLTIVNRLATLV